MLENIINITFSLLGKIMSYITELINKFGLPYNLVLLGLGLGLAFYADKKFHRTYWVFTGIILFLLLLKL